MLKIKTLNVCFINITHIAETYKNVTEMIDNLNSKNLPKFIFVMNSKTSQEERNIFISEIRVLLFKSSNVTQRILFLSKDRFKRIKKGKKKRKNI